MDLSNTRICEVWWQGVAAVLVAEDADEGRWHRERDAT